jgi:uncharacterized protein YjbI with pentapeptide repeats
LQNRRPKLPRFDGNEQEPELETEVDESARDSPQPKLLPRAVAKTESEAVCSIEMGLRDSGRKCARKLHPAPGGVDERPVCLMHSKDPKKQSGAFFEAFWQEFEKILEEAGVNEACFEGFFFPKADLSGREFEAICRFDIATFMHDANFCDATFTQDAVFSGTVFTQNAYFGIAGFMLNADFSGATFTKDVDFGAAAFMQDADFRNATFTQDACFECATFEKKAFFYKAAFMQDADFIDATFKQDAHFYDATFTLKADFEQTIFNGTADWCNCRFLGQAEFRHTEFKSEIPHMPSAIFSLAEFARPGEIVFEDVDLSRALFLNCDVSAVWFTSSVWWARRVGHRGLMVFEEDILLRPEFARLRKEYGYFDHGAVEQIYHQLQKNYDSRLDFRKANDFHYGEMEMRRLEPPAGGLFSILPGFIRGRASLLNLYRLASDYGNSYAKPGAWLIATLLAAMLAFPITGLELKQPSPGNFTSNAVVTYQSVWNQQDSWTDNLWTEGKLVFKSGITAIDTATFQRNPEYSPVYPQGRILGIIETLLTSSLFALSLLAIRRQFRR